MKRTIVRNAYACYFVPWMAATARYPLGRNIFDADWDVCVILDACRADALEQVAGEFDFIETVDSAWSVGSSSKEWMVNTLREDRRDAIEDTVYLTGNGWAKEVLSDDPKFAKWTVLNGSVAKNSSIVERLLYRPTVTAEDFRDVIYQPLSDINGVDAFDPAELTDLAIQAGRKYDDSRLLVHYMQPHAPYLHRVAAGEVPGEIDEDPIGLLQRGHDREEVWEAYVENLRYVLRNVETLIENTEGDVLITADHGEMFQGGVLSGHGEGLPHPKLKRVPWVRTTAKDRGTRDVDMDLHEDSSDDIDERLEALGYL